MAPTVPELLSTSHAAPRVSKLPKLAKFSKLAKFGRDPHRTSNLGALRPRSGRFVWFAGLVPRRRG